MIPILEEIRNLEPIFHAPAFGAGVAEYEERMAAGYWEVGASGRRYSRAFILRDLAGKAPSFAEALGWQTREHARRRLGPATYLFTYVLQQGDRRTRRATIWEHAPQGWRILYYQGTIATTEQDDVTPDPV